MFLCAQYKFQRRDRFFFRTFSPSISFLGAQWRPGLAPKPGWGGRDKIAPGGEITGTNRAEGGRERRGINARRADAFID